jgi:uncharacterized membrane protein YeaQ/YmgE (transglycosylase-associated protein family)
MVINCVLAGVIVALAAATLGAGDVPALISGIVGALVLLVLQAAWGLKSFETANKQMSVRFPTPPGA